MKILILGATGLLGNAMFRVLSETENFLVFGTARDETTSEYFSHPLRSRLITLNNLESPDEVVGLFNAIEPDVVINCTAYRRSQKQEFMRLIAIFSLLPRQLQHLCEERNIRLIHFSSDGVFSGAAGNYTERDMPDANDQYGIAKILGEVVGCRTLTFRTSVLGPELTQHTGLLEWFLRQNGECRCYTRSIFSGFPSVVLAEIIRDIVLPNEELYGIYHLASEAISKFDLLELVRQEYCKEIKMIADESIVINRSLSAERFLLTTGYKPPSWPEMITRMRVFNYGLSKS